MIRQTQIAFCREEDSEGICAVGAALKTRDGEWMAISVPVPSSRFYGNEEKLSDTLREFCLGLERDLPQLIVPLNAG